MELSRSRNNGSINILPNAKFLDSFNTGSAEILIDLIIICAGSLVLGESLGEFDPRQRHLVRRGTSTTKYLVVDLESEAVMTFGK